MDPLRLATFTSGPPAIEPATFRLDPCTDGEVYSLQYECGPSSEASIGNVGLRPNTTGWVDHVVTPAGALGTMVAEDPRDRYLVVRIESWAGHRAVRAIAWMVLDPGRTLSNGAHAPCDLSGELSERSVLMTW
jgi:hypothetical protein